jgi:putative transposase
MIKSIKIRLKPNKTQEVLLYKSANISRFIYNWTLNKQIENYKDGGKFISDNELRKSITQLKKEELMFLNEVSNNVAKQAVKDCCGAYKNFFSKKSKFPKFKSKKKSKLSFYNDNCKLKFKEDKVLIEKIGWVKCSESLTNQKFYNPRISFDNKYWHLSVGIDIENLNEELTGEIIGIDLGIKDLAIISINKVYKNINKSKNVKSLKKKLKRLQKQVSRKYNINKEGNRYQKTANIVKLEKQIRLLYRKLSNIRNNHLHQVTTEIVKTKPSQIQIEDLNIKGIMKNRHLSKAIQEQCLSTFVNYLTYKCEFYRITLVKIPRFYPSSKRCNHCGNIKSDLKLSDRVYRCQCGYIEDRDLNASYNIRDWNN